MRTQSFEGHIRWLTEAVKSVHKDLKEHLPDAADSAYQILLKRLIDLTAPAARALVESRLCEINPLCTLNARLATGEELTQAQEFVEKRLQQEGFACLYERVPALKRLIPKMVENFTAFMAELAQRYAQSQTDIANTLFSGRRPGRLTRITGGIADLHNGGRCTLLLCTETGKFLYKPRDLRSDRLLYLHLIEGFFSDVLCAPRCVLEDGYGFCEFISASPVDNARGIDAYYRNLGIFCALMQALGAADIHAENVLAVGDKPCLVDLETILKPAIKVFNDPEVFPETMQSLDTFTADLNRSLYASALVPNDITGDKNLFYYSGEDAQNLPVWNGTKQDIRGHEDIFFAGFEEGYRRCMACRDDLDRAVRNFADVPLRILLRNTDSYAKVIHRLIRTANLDDQAIEAKVFSTMNAAFDAHGAKHMRTVAEYKAACLLCGDIPCFHVTGGGYDLQDGRRTVLCRGFLSATAVECAQERLNLLCEKELRFEKTLLRRGMENVLSFCDTKQEAICAKAPLPSKTAIDEAERLFQTIVDNTLTSPSGTHSWLMWTDDGKIRVLDIGLANGWSGIALFAGALGRVSQRPETRAQAGVLVKEYLDLLELKLSEMRICRQIPEKFITSGMTGGLGGLLRSLTRLAEVTGDCRAAQIAGEILTMTDKVPLEQAEYLDVYSGVAGLLQAVATADELAGTETGKRCMARCADRLLRAKDLPCGELLLWDTLKKKRPISGMGHGMAGIGLALLEAGILLHHDEYRDAAEDALQFEHAAYDPDIQTWPDFRESASTKQFMHGYCSGAPGIGLAMLQCVRCGDRSVQRMQDLDRARKACLELDYLHRDHVCCGNSAVAEFLLEDGQREAAGRILASMVETANRDGVYSLLPSGRKKSFAPTFFYGYAGIGYTLLRYACPKVIRSALL